jgi:O-antigen/teichoic acid export membrane protein
MKSRILTLAGDTLTYGIFILIGRFLTFLLTPFYTNYLSVEEVGDVGNFFALIAFVNVIYSFGMDLSYFRFYSQSNFQQSKIAFTYSYLTILTISFFVSVALWILAPSYARYLTNLPDQVFLVRLAVLVPLTDCLMVIPYAYLRMTRQVAKFSLIRFSLIVIAVALNIWFVVVMKTGIKGVFYAQLIANAVGVLLFIPIIAKHLTFSLDSKLFKDMLKFGLPTIPATFSGIILQVVDRPILKFLTDSNQVGIYMVNYRLAIPMMLFVAMYDYAWRPFYLSNFESKDAKELFSRIFTYFVYTSGIVFLATAFFIEFLVRLPFFGGRFIEPTYWQGMDIIPIVMFGYIFNGFYINFNAGINIEKKTQYLPVAVGISAIVNIILNFLTIPLMGYRGAAWATFWAYLVSAVIIYYYSQKFYPIRYEWKKIISLGLILLSVFLLINILTKNIELQLRFIVRLLALLFYIAAPFFFGIFGAKEKEFLLNLTKKAFRRK